MGEWKEHKYIAIENGKYIYPEDLKKRNRADARIAAIDARDSGKKAEPVTETKTQKQVWNYNQASQKKEEAKTEQTITKKFKGSVDSYAYLPKNPEVGDTYYLENDMIRVCWNGKGWAKVDKEPIQKPTANNVYNYGGTKSKSAEPMKLRTKKESSSSSYNDTPTIVQTKKSNAYEQGRQWMMNLLGIQDSKEAFKTGQGGGR